jgi:hypothetical protein
MPQPVWRRIASDVAVPEPGKQWRLALDYLAAGKIMMLEVVVDATRQPPVPGTWTPHGFSGACSPDGDFTGKLRGEASNCGAPLVPSAPIGALIARIGGSTADQTLDTGPTPSKIAFSVGSKCVFSVPAAPTGSLFLGVNDDPSRMASVTGQLLVNIYEAV